MSRTADAEMRPRILDAADRLLARRGFRRMTVETIASEAGIGKGSVYLHFASKEEVALSCIDRMAEAVACELEAIARGAGPALPRLRRMLRTRVLGRFDYARRHAHSIDEKLAVMRQAMLARRALQFEREAQLLAQVAAEGVRAGELRPRVAATAGRAMVTATNALLPYSLSVRELGRPAALAGRLEEVISLLLDGLASPGSPAASRTYRRKP